MTTNILKYRTMQLDAKITFCVEAELKEFWDKSIHQERYQLPEVLRTYLRELKAQITEQDKVKS